MSGSGTATSPYRRPGAARDTPPPSSQLPARCAASACHPPRRLLKSHTTGREITRPAPLPTEQVVQIIFVSGREAEATPSPARQVYPSPVHPLAARAPAPALSPNPRIRGSAGACGIL